MSVVNWRDEELIIKDMESKCASHPFTLPYK